MKLARRRLIILLAGDVRLIAAAYISSMKDTLGRNNRSLPDLACAQCGSMFRPARRTSTYCSVPCARKKNGGHNRKPETWWINGKGYVEGRVWADGKQRMVKQHRWVVEGVIGRRLLRHEDVHHINGDKQDNKPENLEILSHGEHSKITNGQRRYKRGYKLSLTDEQRSKRSEVAKRIGLGKSGRAAQGLI